MEDKKIKQLQRAASIELARRDFFHFCSLLAPNFYKEDRPYIVKICKELQEFINSDKKYIIINVPPRHGKSRTLTMFIAWLFGLSVEYKIMYGTYSEFLSTTFSKTVRDMIMEEKTDDRIIYTDIFPKTKIKKGEARANFFTLEGGFSNFLAVSLGSAATGMGCNFLVIDDVIKNYAEACNERVLEDIYNWYTNTMLSRTENGSKIVCVSTRWSTLDLAGRILDYCKEYDEPYIHINMSALQDDGTMLCDEILSRKDYDEKIRVMGEDLVAANYDNKPINIKGVLYTEFKTYDILPNNNEGIYCVVDSADCGEDFLCGIVFTVYNQQAFVIDILYTQANMEITEYDTADMIYRNNVNVVSIEGNSGGRGFARSVSRILKEKYHSNKATIKTYHQNQNKESRILSNATWCEQNIFFPEDWKRRFSKFSQDLMKYQRTGKNLHDDAPDCLTMCCELVQTLSRGSYSKDIYDRGYRTKTVDFSDYYDRYRLKNVF